MDPTWPVELCRYLTQRYGEAESIEPLLGQSQNHVWRVQFAGESRVIKETRGREAIFYECFASRLGHLAPHMERRVGAEYNWLVLEWIPYPLPRHRWLADHQVIESLL